ncbi:unnamed protein product [Rotaria socialis]|uniref:SAM domain-containing protein n=2 Tax=Rotaria socialis TaxID=392032 RepID=A0A817TZE1_9BILA|nr:unnamed protein product [Rotaria socialis]
MDTRRRQKGNVFRQEKTWLDIEVSPNSVVKRIHELEQELECVPGSIDRVILNRVLGSMAGLALGDALGAHVEFKPHDILAVRPVKDLQGGGTWGLNKGEFTDDTSMALCLANSLITCHGFCSYDQLVRYKWWFHHGYMSATGKCFDIGGATKKSLIEFERRQFEFCDRYKLSTEQMDYLKPKVVLTKFNVMCSEPNVAGNGALMRLAPVPLFFYRDPKKAVDYCELSATPTHGDQRAYDACRFYGALIVAALRGEKKNQLLDANFYEKHKDWFDNKPLHPEIVNIMRGSYRKEGGYSEGIRGTGFIVSALEAALWAFCYDRDSFEYGALAAVNLGDDTDTTASIYGQLAGAYYGYQTLPKRWLQYLYGKNFINCLSEWIVYAGEQWFRTESQTTVSSAFAPKEKPVTHLLSVEPSSTLQAHLSSDPSKSRQRSADRSERYERYVSQHNPQITVETEHKEYDKPNRRLLKPTTTTASSSLHNSNITRAIERPPASKYTMPFSRPKPLQYRQSAPIIQAPSAFSGVETCDDVCSWIMAFGQEYEQYVLTMKRYKVDGMYLLRYVNREKLFQYGILDASHQQRILDGIEELKKQIMSAVRKNNNIHTASSQFERL